MSDTERQVAERLVRDALAEHTITVLNGESPPAIVLRQSDNEASILAAMFTGGEDTIVLYRKDNGLMRVGFVDLMYEGGPALVVADHTPSATVTAILAGARKLATDLAAEGVQNGR